nr:hypothetical protein CTI12_AA150370 [Tanacetum cinerariifolium]
MSRKVAEDDAELAQYKAESSERIDHMEQTMDSIREESKQRFEGLEKKHDEMMAILLKLANSSPAHPTTAISAATVPPPLYTIAAGPPPLYAQTSSPSAPLLFGDDGFPVTAHDEASSATRRKFHNPMSYEYFQPPKGTMPYVTAGIPFGSSGSGPNGERVWVAGTDYRLWKLKMPIFNGGMPMGGCIWQKDGSLNESRFDEPMPWIGIYVAGAALACGIAMTMDALHGFRYKNFWFPCKFFALNATILALIAIAIKFSMDLNATMLHRQDQLAKVSSSAFICAVMDNLLHSLGTMKNTELFLNVVALAILVITADAQHRAQPQMVNYHGAHKSNHSGRDRIAEEIVWSEVELDGRWLVDLNEMALQGKGVKETIKA